MRGVWVAAGVVVVSACSIERPQLLVLVDTDAHLIADVRPEVSLDAAIDTLRVDMLDSKNAIYATQQFVVADSSQWPVSFGVVPAAKGGTVRMRLRAFRGRFAQAGSLFGASVLDPLAEATIDRLVDVAMPVDGPRRVRIMLAMDCLGTRPSFASPEATCIDGATLAGPPSAGVADTTDVTSTHVNTWSDALERPCAVPVASGRSCIRGGFTLLGDDLLTGLQGQTETKTTPLRPVVITPFVLDVHEYTVGRFRALLARGPFDAPMPREWLQLDPNYKFCTWLPTDTKNDALPINCIEWETAKRICELEGGVLPTEAQWEHAARGRGEQRLFPWGNQNAECCTSALSRKGPPPDYSLCPGVGVAPVGSHVAGATCAFGDVSRDGIFDLGGNVSEAVLDTLDGYDSPCWHSKGILRDPVCRNANAPLRRGGAWLGGRSLAASALRNLFSAGLSDGVRCAYRGVP